MKRAAKDCGHCECRISYETLEVESQCAWHLEHEKRTGDAAAARALRSLARKLRREARESAASGGVDSWGLFDAADMALDEARKLEGGEARSGSSEQAKRGARVHATTKAGGAGRARATRERRKR